MLEILKCDRITTPPDMVDFINNFKNSGSKLFQTVADRTKFVPSFQVGMKEAIHSKNLKNRGYSFLSPVIYFVAETSGKTVTMVSLREEEQREP
ncbi:hypothetical protein E2C01_050434 [Portunus trituberculatus]|uniref:Uncharacterized protein n=1 Tax=Portunus trituberculatus TaxID=210409 RepID=A0A5B7GIY7_PORTR|nr:hypothetical protein [Portunus trituberculatus]